MPHASTITPSPPHQSPLADAHLRLGAKMCPFGGWSMPLRYTSERSEHLAVRSACGVFDLSHMAEIVVAGPRAAARLDATFVGEMSAVGVGRAKYTLLCDDGGGVLDDVVVYRLADEEFMVVANAVNRSVVVSALGAGDAGCSIDDATDRTALIAVQGPLSAGVVGELLGEEVGSMRYYSVRSSTFGRAPVTVARTGYTGEVGFELYAPPDLAERLWRSLVEQRGLTPVGLAARDSLRLEAGMHLYGNELTPEITPIQAGLARTVAWDKPVSFPGDAALREAASTPPSTRLVGLVATRPRIVRSGSVVRLPTGEEVGRVTSGGFGFTVGASIAMAYVASGAWDDGIALEVDTGRSTESVVTTSLPFYARPKGQ